VSRFERNEGLLFLAAVCLFSVIACATLRGAEKEASSDLKTVAADYTKAVKDAQKFCADVPAVERAGVLTGQAAKDADAFCEGVARAASTGISVTVVTPAGSATVSVPAVNVGGAPAVGGAPSR
jgi:hypothetical protein